jgi:hypothetical protein
MYIMHIISPQLQRRKLHQGITEALQTVKANPWRRLIETTLFWCRSLRVISRPQGQRPT